MDRSTSICKIKQSRFLKMGSPRSSEHRNLFTSGNDELSQKTVIFEKSSFFCEVAFLGAFE
jgi:hypothetical protein